MKLDHHKTDRSKKLLSSPYRSCNGIRSNFIKLIYDTISWMSGVYCTRFPLSVVVFTPLLLKLDRILLTRGNMELIKYVKSIRLQLFHYLSNNGIRVEGVKCTREGIPTALGDLVPKVRQANMPEIEKSILPYLMTILFATRALKVSTTIDVDPIEAPRSHEVPAEITKHINSF